MNDFTFDEKTHTYKSDGKPVTGVTTILSCIAKPALIQWSANMAVDFLETIYKVEGKLSDLFFKEARTVHRKKKQDAGAKGTDIHAIIETIIKEAIEKTGGIISGHNVNEEPQVTNFIKWAIEKKVKFLVSEKRLYSVKHWIAGTCDFTCEIDGRRYVGDLKTSTGIYPEMFFQVGAYRMMLEEMGEPEYVGSIIVRCGKKGDFETKERFEYESDLKGFLGAVELYRALQTFN